jgi:tetratricopeptide (TPR) repeat protein
MIDLKKEHLAAMMEAGYIYLGMRRYKEAKELFEGLIVLAPGSEIPHVALGNVEFCQGRLAKAVKHYEKAIKIDKNSNFACVYMGEALLFLGKNDKAMELLEAVAKRDNSGAGEFAKALITAVEGGFNPLEARKNNPGKEFE